MPYSSKHVFNTTIAFLSLIGIHSAKLRHQWETSEYTDINTVYLAKTNILYIFYISEWIRKVDLKGLYTIVFSLVNDVQVFSKEVINCTEVV